MNKFSLSVHQYREKLESAFGYADDEMVKRYAKDRQKWKQGQQKGSFNPYTQDPNCKNCGKDKRK